jgi:hypothetical protein
MRIGLYSPYMQTMGGGERYMLSIAMHLSLTHQVTLFADASIAQQAKKFFGMDLGNITFIPPGQISASGQFNRFRTLSKFDVFFAMTDGSVFFFTS